MPKIQNINIKKLQPLISPANLKEELPASRKVYASVESSRQTVEDIIARRDKRLLAIVGPCSIHNTAEALEYASRLKGLHEKFKEKFFVIMRVYFEKPRTTVGWKGVINDPDLDNTKDMPKGLRTARKLLLQIADMGLPAACEMLDPISPQYLSDLVSWASLGARTSESQTHREMASGLSMPVGYKNSTDGGLDAAIYALQAARHQHTFLGIDRNGCIAIVTTKGNPGGHLILRGGNSGPNYHPKDIKRALEKLKKSEEEPVIMVDCSHGNSLKDPEKQPIALQSVIRQVTKGNEQIIGFMLESNLEDGNQKVDANHKNLKYGVSITDPCLGWEKTEKLLESMYNKL